MTCLRRRARVDRGLCRISPIVQVRCLGCYSSRRLKDAKKWGICLTQVARVLSSHMGREAELVECTGKLSGAAAGAVRDGLHLLFDRL
jgi:hypothetical protein